MSSNYYEYKWLLAKAAQLYEKHEVPRVCAGRPQGAGAPGREGYLADNGCWGQWWQQHWHDDSGAALTTPTDYPGPPAAPARRPHRRRWQSDETSNGHLIHSFGLHFPGARSPWGLLTRLAAKRAAVHLGHWLNHLCGRPALAFATLFVG